MTTSSQSYKQLAIPYFKEVFDLIDAILRQEGKPHYLIGSNSAFLNMLERGIKPPRGTKDIDFAIMVSTSNEYRRIEKKLIDKGFVKLKTNWRFNIPSYDVKIDILPFGEIENQSGDFSNREIEFHAFGLKEVLENSMAINIEDRIVKIPLIPGMVILKFISWNDRPEHRNDDLKDLIWMITNYYDSHFEEILENHSDLFIDDFKAEIVSATVLGRESQIYISKSPKLKQRLLEILEINTKEQKSKITTEWASLNEWTIDYAFKILKAFYSSLIS